MNLKTKWNYSSDGHNAILNPQTKVWWPAREKSGWKVQAKYVDGGTTIGWIRINHKSFKSILIRLAWLNRGGRADWKSQRLSSSAVTLSSYIRTNSGKHVRVSATRSSWDNLHKNKTNDTWRTYIYIHVAYIYVYTPEKWNLDTQRSAVTNLSML